MKISICLVILIFLIPALKIQAQEATPDATPNPVCVKDFETTS